MRLAAALALQLALLATLAVAAAPARDVSTTAQRFREQPDRALEDTLRAIARTAPGQLLVEARLLPYNRVARLGADKAAPMASTYKLPIAVAVLSEVDAGRMQLSRKVRLLARDMHPGVSRLAERYPEGGVDRSVGQLLEEMLITSDNSACDALLRVLGGGAEATARMRELGVAPMRIDRSEMQLGDDAMGVVFPWHDSLRTRASVQAAWRSAKPEQRAAGLARMLADPRDTATPAAMNLLLERIWRREALSPARTDTLLGWMSRSTTGTHRLRAGVPRQVAVLDRTGTGPTTSGRTLCVNAVGLLRLPGSGGWVAITVFLRDVRGDIPTAEHTIARVARATFDQWNAPD